jgi:hypothetical protein
MNHNKRRNLYYRNPYIDNPASNCQDEVFEKGEYILDVGEDSRITMKFGRGKRKKK